MAKWGESDPRWIVEERPDATNVNNWHWTEKNATDWSREKLKSLLMDVQVSNNFADAKITEVSKCEGEASANMRKAKLIFFYEWEVKCEWIGELDDGDKEYKGTLSITNLSEENDPDETEIVVTAKDEKSDEAYKLKELMRVKGVIEIRKVVKLYVEALKKEYSQGMILPTKEKAGQSRQSDTSITNVTKQLDSNLITTSGKSSAKTVGGVKLSVTTIKEKANFKCRIGDLYQALTDKQMAMMWTRGSVGMFETEKGGRFVLFDGNVHGEFTLLERDSQIRMRWRMKNWPDEHYSEVLLELTETDEDTTLQITQTGVPADKKEATAQGWRRYYWNSIKEVFGWGAPIC